MKESSTSRRESLSPFQAAPFSEQGLYSPLNPRNAWQQESTQYASLGDAGASHDSGEHGDENHANELANGLNSPTSTTARTHMTCTTANTTRSNTTNTTHTTRGAPPSYTTSQTETDRLNLPSYRSGGSASTSRHPAFRSHSQRFAGGKARKGSNGHRTAIKLRQIFPLVEKGTSPDQHPSSRRNTVPAQTEIDHTRGEQQQLRAETSDEDLHELSAQKSTKSTSSLLQSLPSAAGQRQASR